MKKRKKEGLVPHIRAQRLCEGFTLIEMLIYITIFVVSAGFLVTILTSVSGVQIRQVSHNTVNEQIEFAADTIERFIRTSSNVDMVAGVPGDELVLLMRDFNQAKTRIYEEDGRLFYTQNGVPIAITSSDVEVTDFRVVKRENLGGRATVQTDIAMRFKTDDPRKAFSRSLETIATRVSAATFDSPLIPGGAAYDIGTAAQKWQNAYFSGSVGVGVNAPTGNQERLRVAGDIVISEVGSDITSGRNIILRTADGSACFSLGFDNNGSFVTSSAACP